MLERFEKASGFVFDCDGTLLDTMKVWRRMEDDLIAMCGGHVSDEDFTALQALDIDAGARLLHERYGAGESAQDIVDAMDARLLGFYANEVEPYDGAREFVDALRDRGIPCCIVSSSPVRYLEAGFARCGMLDRFEALVSTETAGLSKQDVGIYRLAVEKMGARVESTWGADDSLYAIRAMNEAGLQTLATYEDDKAGTFEQLSEHAVLAVRSFRELLV